MATEASRQNQAVAHRIGIGLLLLGVCGSVSGVLIGFGMARSVHRSLVEISVPVHDIAGRLNDVVGPIKVSSNTDLSELDGALRMLANKTGDVVHRLQESQQQSLRHEQLAAVGQFAAGLAHELRNPLMSMKLIVQTAAERADKSLNTRDLAVIETEITRLERMLQTFLDFARPPRPDKQLVNIVELAESTMEVVRPRAAQQDVQLKLSAQHLDLSVEADASQLRQVLLNLLINALDALPGGGNVSLEISAQTETTSCESDDTAGSELEHGMRGQGQADQLNWVVIRVADDGPGVSPDVMGQVFEPFVSMKVTGIGLGLSISRRIVESHNGHIAVQNREEGGAEFTIRLPSNSFDRKQAAGDLALGSPTPTRAPADAR